TARKGGSFFLAGTTRSLRLHRRRWQPAFAQKAAEAAAALAQLGGPAEERRFGEAARGVDLVRDAERVVRDHDVLILRARFVIGAREVFGERRGHGRGTRFP